MKTYEVQVRIEGTIDVEDPNCPSGWRGSGCYDIDVPAEQRVTVTVPANNEGLARNLAQVYCYEGEGGCELESVNDVEIKCVIPCGESDDPGMEFDWGELEVPEDNGPDPDDYYEERREREME